MSHTWLQKKRKGELLELAIRASVPDADSLLKDDLVAALEEQLDNNESIYAKNPAFVEYYSRAGSPVKRSRSPQEPVAAKTRRRTLLKSSTSITADEPQSTPERSALVPRTPRVVSQPSRRVSQPTPSVASPVGRVLESELPLPPSPAQLADVADQSFQVAKTKAAELWDRTRIDELREFVRENVSSVSAIQTLILIIEATGLQYNTLVTEYALQTPAVGGLGVRSRDVHLPNLWLLLTSEWWGPATLWSVTSWALPLFFSYFFNLTLRSNTRHRSSGRQSSVDPLTFNIVKAILAYSAYHIHTQVDAALAGQSDVFVAQTPGWGPFHESSVNVVRNNVPGGYYGLQIGAVVGVLVSLYDAALKK